MFKLTPKQAKFARLYFETGKISESYRASYDTERMNDSTVANAATDLLKHSEVIAYLDDMRESAEYVSQLNVAWLIKQHMQIATADINELIESRRINCRHCYGIDHKYQWVDENEWAKALGETIDRNQHREVNNAKRPEAALPCEPLPTYEGGGGFWGTNPPNEKCPVCFGNGHQEVHIHDTRKLKGAAKLVYSGVKQTNQGTEVKLRNQDALLDWLAKYLGLDKKTLELSGPGGGPIAMSHLKAEELTDDQLAALVGKVDENDNAD